MADDNKREEALAALAQVWPPDGSYDEAAYRLLGADGVLKLMQQAARPDPLSAPSADEDAGPELPDSSSPDWMTKYLAVRGRLFDQDDARRSSKK
jgi:hypothetical protein